MKKTVLRPKTGFSRISLRAKHPMTHGSTVCRTDFATFLNTEYKILTKKNRNTF